MLELAHLRNRLAVSQFGEPERMLLNQLKDTVEHSNSPFSKMTLLALENCVADLKVKDFEAATREIQLVHNFLVAENEYTLWDEEHFYRIELLSYIEEVNCLHRIKQLIKGLAEIDTLIQNQPRNLETDLSHSQSVKPFTAYEKITEAA